MMRNDARTLSAANSRCPVGAEPRPGEASRESRIPIGLNRRSCVWLCAAVLVLLGEGRQAWTQALVVWKDLSGQRDCGVNCLYIACKLLGKDTDKRELAVLAGLSEKGTNFAQMQSALAAKGLHCKAVQWELRQFETWEGLAIAHWEDHFVLTRNMDRNSLILIDPPSEPVAVPFREFAPKWDGNLILVSAEPIPALAGLHVGQFVPAIVVLFVIIVLVVAVRWLHRKPGPM